MPVSPPARTLAPASELPDDRYLNRELSWLDFNARVLALAEDPSQPLLERAKFLAIFAANLDEFYMVRVAGLKRRDETGPAVRSADGLSPREQLARIADAQPGHRRARTRGCFLDDVAPELAEQGIRILRWADLADDRARPAVGRTSAPRSSRCSPRSRSTRRTRSRTSPGSRSTWRSRCATPKARTERFARVKVPNNVPRLVQVRTERRPAVVFLPVEDLIAAHLGELFAGMEVVERARCSGSPATPTSRSRRTATRTCCRRWSASWPAAGSARRCGSRSPTR